MPGVPSVICVNPDLPNMTGINVLALNLYRLLSKVVSASGASPQSSLSAEASCTGAVTTHANTVEDGKYRHQLGPLPLAAGFDGPLVRFCHQRERRVQMSAPASFVQEVVDLMGSDPLLTEIEVKIVGVFASSVMKGSDPIKSNSSIT